MFGLKRYKEYANCLHNCMQTVKMKGILAATLVSGCLAEGWVALGTAHPVQEGAWSALIRLLYSFARSVP